MSEAMTQEDAMKMDNRQAAELLKPLRDMMIDQNGCPVSSAVFALDKAIEALTADVRENVKAQKVLAGGILDGTTHWYECSCCHGAVDILDAYCKHCGALLELENDL